VRRESQAPGLLWGKLHRRVPVQSMTSPTDYIISLRPRAYWRGDVLHFDSLPLFLPLSEQLDDDAILKAIEHAVNDGFGAPEDIDAADEEQTTRLEAAIMDLAGAGVSIRELLTVRLRGWSGTEEVTLFVTGEGKTALLGAHLPGAVPAFLAFALGPEDQLLERMRTFPETVLPRMIRDDIVVGIAPRRRLPYTLEELLEVVRAITGFAAGEHHVLRRELLA
jgi:hypothetical protein